MRLEYSEVEKTAAILKFRTKTFIDGKFVNAKSGKTYVFINPATGQPLTNIASCDTEDVNLAIKAARRSFEAGVWAKRSPAERKHVLLKLADLIEKNLAEIALLDCLDAGKPITDCMTIDAPDTVHCFRWHAEAVDKEYEKVAPTGPVNVAIIVREPLGVIGAILSHYPADVLHEGRRPLLQFPVEAIEGTLTNPRSVGLALRFSGRIIAYAVGSPLENHDEEGVHDDPHYGEHETFYLLAMAVHPSVENSAEIEHHLLELLRRQVIAQGYQRLSALVEERFHEGGPPWLCSAEVLRIVDNYLRSGVRFVYLHTGLAKEAAGATATSCPKETRRKEAQGSPGMTGITRSASALADAGFCPASRPTQAQEQIP